MTLTAETLSRTVTFESTVPWQAQVAETRAETWLTIAPTSGPTGQNSLTITLAPNPGKDSRTAVITIQAGTEKAIISVTQAGTDEQPDPTPDPTAPENLLTQVDFDYVWQEPAGSGIQASPEHRRGFIRVEYDDQNRAIFFGEYEFDGETDKLSYYSETKYDRSQKNKIVENENYFEIDTWSSPKGYPTAYKEDFTEYDTYELDAAGRIVERSGSLKEAGEGDYRYHYTYNADGMLTQYSSYQHGNLETISYEWTNGNIAARTETGSGYSYRIEYTYTEYPNTWYGIDLTSDLDDVTHAYTLGILGRRNKNLIATKKTSTYGDTDTYEYTFDEKGRIATLTITERETRQDVGTAIGTNVYTYHYGPTPKPTYDEALHLTRQEIVDEGTRDHSNGDSYISYLKLRNHFSDGTTQEDEATQEVRMTMNYESIPYQTIPANTTITATAPNSVTLEPPVSEYNNNVTYRYMLHYAYFDIPTIWMVNVPVYSLYTGYEKRYLEHPMPARAITKETFVYDTPTITAYEDGSYYFKQNIRAQLTPNAPATVHTVGCQLVPAAE